MRLTPEYYKHASLGHQDLDRSFGSQVRPYTYGDPSRIPLRTFLLKEVLARASYSGVFKNVSLGLQDLDRSLGRQVRPYTETRQPIRPKDACQQETSI